MCGELRKGTGPAVMNGWTAAVGSIVRSGIGTAVKNAAAADNDLKVDG